MACQTEQICSGSVAKVMVLKNPLSPISGHCSISRDVSLWGLQILWDMPQVRLGYCSLSEAN